MSINVYKVLTELPDVENWDSFTVAAKTFNEAVKKASKKLSNKERIAEVLLLARGEY